MIDKNHIFCEELAVTASAASTDVIDTVDGNIGASGKMELVVGVDETFTAAGAATLTISLQDSADNSTFADVFASKAIPKADLVASPADAGEGSTDAAQSGQIIMRQALPKLPELRRYVRAYFTVATGPMTAGKLSAYIERAE